MNCIYRLVFKRSRNMWQTVTGATHCQNKPHRSHNNAFQRFAFVETPLHSPITSLSAALVFAGLFAMPGSAQSTDATGLGDWNTPATWTSGVPDSTTDAHVPNAAGPVTLNAAGAARALEMQGSGEVIVTTGGSLVVGGIINVGTTTGGPARLTIQGGTVSARNLFAGDAFQQGIVTVTGAGSSLTLAPLGLGQADRFEIGGSGAGELHIDAGANVTVNGTRTLHVGDAANGTLFIGSGAGAGTLTADSVILGTAGSSVQFNHTGTTTFAAAVSGNGSLSKTGAGTTILTGANTYTGGTTVNGGTLQGDATSLQGNITNNANISFNQAVNGTYAGQISGIGSLTKTGSGTVILTGTNNYSGGTTVTAGTLQGNTSSLQGNITNNAAINFDQATNGTYASAMVGIGILTKTGAGNLVLTGINNYTGTTTVNSGTLSVNGSITSATTVNSGGILGGNGSLGATTIASGGVLAPGNSIGTLTVNGNLTFATGSIYRVEVDAVGANDRTNATGSATINGGTVDVQASAGTYQASTQYTILNATGGRTGNFAGVTSNLAFLTPTLSYDPNNVYLHLARNNIAFSNVAATPNQRASSTALEKAAVGASGDLSTVLTAVTGSSTEQARAAYDAIGGAGLVELRRAAPAFANNFGNQLRARLNAVGTSNTASASAISLNGLQLAANNHINDLMPALTPAPQQKFTLAGGIPQTPTDTRGFWLRAYGGDQHTDSDGNAAGNRIKDVGISVGFDTKVSKDLVVGAALTHGSADINTDNNENGRSRGNAVALYGSYATDAWNFNGSATLARNDNRMQRRIAFGGIDRIARSDFDSNTAALYGEVTYDVAMAGWTLQPLMGLSLSRNKSDAFTEIGADALNLQVPSQTVNSTKTLFGAKAIFDFDKVQLQPRVIWSHEFGDANRAMTTQLQGAPTPFAIAGVDLPRDTLITGMTIVGRTNKQLSLFADVQGEFNSQQTNLGLLVGLRASW